MNSSAPTVIHPEYPALDTLRAVAAIGVLSTHAAFNTGSYGSFGVIGPLLARMDVGVAIFFVLSGFLLTRPWFARRQAGLPHPGVARYFERRLLRIFPAYLVVALTALALIPSNDHLGPVGWIKALFMVDIYGSEKLPFGLTQTWSLATEVSFYLVLPALMWLALGRSGPVSMRRVGLLLTGMAGLTVLWLTYLSARVPTHPAHVNEWLPAFGTWFGVGIAFAALSATSGGEHDGADGRVRVALRRLGNSPGACWCIALALMLVATTPLAGPTLLIAASPSEALVKNFLYAAIAGLIVLTGIHTRPEGTYLRVLSLPALRHLGHISYGVFLVHMSILHFVFWVRDRDYFTGGFLEVWLSALILSLIAAELLYRLVEMPAMRLRPGRRKSPATAATPESTTITR